MPELNPDPQKDFNSKAQNPSQGVIENETFKLLLLGVHNVTVGLVTADMSLSNLGVEQVHHAQNINNYVQKLRRRSARRANPPGPS